MSVGGVYSDGIILLYEVAEGAMIVRCEAIVGSVIVGSEAAVVNMILRCVIMNYDETMGGGFAGSDVSFAVGYTFTVGGAFAVGGVAGNPIDVVLNGVLDTHHDCDATNQVLG